MDVNFSQLYQKEIASSLSLLEELIIDVHNEIQESGISTKWLKVGDIEGYFFCIIDPNNKNNLISFGTWNPLWIKTGVPLSIMFEFKSFSNNSIIEIANSFLATNNIKSIEVIECEGEICLIFSEQYLSEIKYLKDIVNMIIYFVEKFEFAFKLNKKKW
jgi:hypothetical protein